MAGLLGAIIGWLAGIGFMFLCGFRILEKLLTWWENREN